MADMDWKFSKHASKGSTLKGSLACVFLLAFIIYSNSLEGEFVYDDTRAILRNEDLKPSSPWTNILYNDFWGTPLEHSGSHKSYRPICVFTFRLNFLFGRFSPWGYHMVNTGLHAIVSCLYTYVSWKLLENHWVTLVSGLLFVAHPVHTEAVSGVVGRADVGAALFFLLAIISYMNITISPAEHPCHALHWKPLFGTLFFATCSLFTKEQGVTVLAVVAAYEVLFLAKVNFACPGKAVQKMYNCGSLKRIAILICYAALVLYIRSVVMGHSPPSFSPADNPAANDPVLLTRLLTFLYLPVCNLWLLLFPWNLSYDWSEEAIPLVTSVNSSENILTVLLYASLSIVAIVYMKFEQGCVDTDENFVQTKAENLSGHAVRLASLSESKQKSNSDCAGSGACLNDLAKQSWSLTIFSLAAMILPFIPATNLFFYVGFVVAERILYIPSIGFCLLVANGTQVLTLSYPNFRKKLLSFMFALAVLFAGRTYYRNYAWKNAESLYRSGISTSPAKSYANLGNILKDQNKLNEAEEAYRAALSHRSNMGDTHYNLGLLMQEAKRYDEAVTFYRNAIVCRPRLAAAHLNLGITLNAMGDQEQGLKVLVDAMNISDHGLKDPTAHAISLTNIRYNAGRILFDMNKHKEAIAMYFNSIDIMPSTYEPHSIYNSLGQAYSALGDSSSAEMWYIRSLKSKPDHYTAMLTFGTHLGVQGKQAEAEKYFKQAIATKPALVEPYMHYAQYLTSQKKLREAVEVMEKVLTFDSLNPHALSGIAGAYRYIVRMEKECKVRLYAVIPLDHRDLKLYNEAEKYQLMAVEVSPNEARYMNDLAIIYHLMEKWTKAHAAYKAVYRVEPHHEHLLSNIIKLEKIMKEKAVPFVSALSQS